MPYSGGILILSAASFLGTRARAAGALSLVVSCILFVPCVSVLAMSASESESRTHPHSRQKPFFVGELIRADDGRERQTEFGAGANRVGFQAGEKRKIGRDMFLAFHYDTTGASPVDLVLATRGPSAVARLIVPVVVDSINAGAIGTRPHVGQPYAEIIPSRADRDSAPTIVIPLSVVRVAATAAHGFPNIVERVLVFGWHPALCHAMQGGSNPLL